MRVLICGAAVALRGNLATGGLWTSGISWNVSKIGLI